MAFEFASRLALDLPGSDPIVVSIFARGLKDRELWIEGGFNFHSAMTPRAHDHEFDTSEQFERDRLISNCRSIALDKVQELLEIFDYDPPMEMLKSIRDEFDHF